MNNYIIMLKRGIFDKKIRFRYLTKIGLYNRMPDEKYLLKKFELEMGRKS